LSLKGKPDARMKKKRVKNASRMRWSSGQVKSKVQAGGHLFVTREATRVDSKTPTESMVGGENGEGTVFPGDDILVGGDKTAVMRRGGVFSIKEMEVQDMSLVKIISPGLSLTPGLVGSFLDVDTMSRFRSERGRILSGNLPRILWQRMFMGKRSNTMVEFVFLVDKNSGQPDIQQLFDSLWGIGNFLAKGN
jgi:hypothetical protein